MTYFEPPPTPAEVPTRLASPFDPGLPHPLARRAADALQRSLRHGGFLGAGFDPCVLDAPGGGKMFGVLVVEAEDGRVGYLQGFSGMLGGRWEVEGFAPPLFDPVARDSFWPAGEAELAAFEQRHAELCEGAEPVALRASLAALTARHAEAAARMRTRHEANRDLRHEARRRLEEGEAGVDARRAALHALGQESRADAAERQRLEVTHAEERAPLVAALRGLDERLAEVEHLRAERSRRLWMQLAHTYVIPNARGERQPLAALFAPEPPPGGAGDCAAPKLFAWAYAHRLKPLALAEFWWGAPPLRGERQAGAFYPACQSKCGRVLPYMLEGLSVEPAPPVGLAARVEEEPRVVFEDPWLLVVDKPRGLLSVPGRHDRQRDSVLVRLQRRFPDAASWLAVYPLEAEVSGLLLVAKTPETQAALLRQLGRREAEVRFVAWVEGLVTGDQGVVELPLRLDPENRVRHLIDPAHGSRAVSEWRVLQRLGHRTRVAWVPRTRVPHQLLAHAAHPLGLGIPIVGDRVYGREDSRLMLHAESLSLRHPRTGEPLDLEAPSPF